MKTLAEVEKNYILHVLDELKGNRVHTAKMLKIGIRTLQRKLHQYGLPAGKGGGGNYKAVFCVESNTTYPSRTDAARACTLLVNDVALSVRTGQPVRGFTFKEVT